MTRRCSHCSHNGHNSRTCPNKGVKLFGVRLTDGSIRKSASMGNLTHYMGSGGGSGSATPQNGPLHESPAGTPDHPSAGSGGVADGYASEDFVNGSSSSARERKKGVPWTEEEHRMFLLGLQKLGKGDWRGISRNYVITRTPTQVASHAQKYFIRQSNMSRRKRRSSLFDIVADAESSDAVIAPRDFFSSDPPHKMGTDVTTTVPPPPPPPPPMVEEECESMESANSNENEPLPPTPEYPQYHHHPQHPFLYPAYVAAPLFPMPVPIWAPAVEPDPEPMREETAATTTTTTTHELVRPLAVHSKSPINVDELVSMSNLSLGESGPSMLSLRLGEGSSRPSAFHANPSSSGSGVNNNPSETSTIRAV